VKYRTILIDPPWAQGMLGKYKKTRHKRPDNLPYATMSLEQIAALPISQLAEEGAHLWLWTTNAFLPAAFRLIEAWGFTYLSPVVWIKPSGFGNYFISRTQFLIFAYFRKCQFRKARYRPNVLFAPSRKHSQKPECSYQLIEEVSDPPRLELFARSRRAGWQAWGNEVESDLIF
jgi:N6-adenosine-specific RNA methylase IME4